MIQRYGQYASTTEPIITENRPSDIMEEGRRLASDSGHPKFVRAPMIPRSLAGGAVISKLNKLECKD